MKLLYWITISLILGCTAGELTLEKLEGKTMGTTYHISYTRSAQENSDQRDVSTLKPEIDSLLVDFNNSVSTYIPSSTISRVNQPDTAMEVDQYFATVFKRAQEVSEKTGGAFDVTVMPLVNGWGFGYTDTIRMDSVMVDSLLQLVGYQNVSLVEKDGKYFIHKKDKRNQVDFSAIAKGYGVDLIAQLLEKKGIENYMVEIGGEVRTKGLNIKREKWKIGIEKPIENPGPGSQELKEILHLENKSLATSGNYRNFYYRNGKKVSHEIDPKTGYPAQNNVLSATVISDDCMTADAFATAFMVMGLEKTLAYLKQDTSLDAFLIFAGDNGEMKSFQTDRINSMIAGEK